MVEKNMSWVTIYMTGESDFREDVRKRLEHSDIQYLQGYIESPNQEITHDLFWLDNLRNLKGFKEAIGAKYIWRHRIRFYTTLESFLASQQSTSDKFSIREQQMVEKMQIRYSDQVL
jgi:hypothetical protein